MAVIQNLTPCTALLKVYRMQTEPDIISLEDGSYRVCLKQDEIEACTTCSSMHLIDDKVAQLKRCIERYALEAYEAA